MENDLIPIDELCIGHNIESSFIVTLYDYGLIQITTIETQQFVSKEQLNDIERMIRLHYDLDINIEGIDAIANLLKRLDSLQSELNYLKRLKAK
jgi:hypothetical protein